MPDCAVTTDVIAGFVGETKEEHLETCAFVRRIGFARMHVFPYSRRKGTAADSMEGHLDRSVKERRASELIAVGKEMEETFVESLIRTEQMVLIEDDGTGYTGNYVRVRCSGPEGELVRVRITGCDHTIANGEVIS
jgi:threonylcarbamoyladenosine tRNA methylthiotransferase MtaB